MMKLSLKYTLFLLVLLLISIRLPLYGQTGQQETSVTAIMPSEGENLEKLNRLISEHEGLLQKYPQGEFVPTILLQLAQLYQRQATILFQRQMEEYETKLEAFDKGELAQEPIMPRMSLQKSIDHLYRLVTDYPNLPSLDKALYMLAMAHLQEGNLSRAQIYFEQIIQDFPQSPINIESHFRIGEYYFDKREYRKAISHYNFLLNQWNNPYFDMALYKLGWSYYNLNDHANAITTFIYLLEDIALIERTDTQILSKSKADLSQEAIQYIASCYTEYGGAAAAKSFLADRIDKPYTLAIFLSMGEIYQRRNYFPEAIEAYESLLSLYPHYEKAPEIYTRIVENHEKNNNIEEGNKTRERIVAEFGPGGSWLAKYPQGETYQSAMQLARESLRYLGTFHQSEAQKKDRVRDYQIAVFKYLEYLDKFPFAADAAEIHYYLAECYYALGDLNHAAKTYYEIFIKYDSSQYRHDAAYNRVLCHNQLLGTDEPMDTVGIYIDPFIGTGEKLRVRLTHESEIDLLRACNDFVRFFPESKWHDQILMKYAETLHELEHYNAAIQVYKKVVERGPDKPYYLSAAMNTGQCYFDAGFFTQANSWFSTLAKNFPDSVRHSQKAVKMASLAKFKIAEDLSNSGKTGDAASVLYEIAKETQDDQLRDRALFEAASQYQKLNKNTEAALALEELARTNSGSELADEALYRAATLRELNEEWTLAAANYLRLSEQYPNSPYAMRAMKNAALSYEIIQDWYAAENVYKHFVRQFPDSLTEVLECLCKSGEMAYKTNRFQEAMEYYQRTVDTYKENLHASLVMDHYYVAQAQFMIGEILFADYKKVNLDPPFDVALKRKVARFNEVFQAYKETLEYQIADWSTAASCRIGMCFEEFVRAFLESPPPAGLAEEEVPIYRARLAETAKPYKERAMETYKKTIDQAEANNIENSWVLESRKRLRALMLDITEPTESEQIPAQEADSLKRISNS
ncbi:tetratricopeptide repeat protein [candidate division KSB1 bacterium]|nr:tetratricopeptide repeat protein [candidate division KSB1 bacterium]